MTVQTKTSIGLSNGDFFDFLNPMANEFDIRVIAYSLSNLCRYGGHSRKFYSVAEHCVLVSLCVPHSMALTGLLHDASEAYVGDMPSPLKKLCADYREIEDAVQEALAKKHNLPYPFPHEIHVADKSVYIAERQQITNGKDEIWHTEFSPAPVKVIGLSPAKAERLFIRRYEELTQQIALAA